MNPLMAQIIKLAPMATVGGIRIYNNTMQRRIVRYDTVIQKRRELIYNYTRDLDAISSDRRRGIQPDVVAGAAADGSSQLAAAINGILSALGWLSTDSPETLPAAKDVTAAISDVQNKLEEIPPGAEIGDVAEKTAELHEIFGDLAAKEDELNRLKNRLAAEKNPTIAARLSREAGEILDSMHVHIREEVGAKYHELANSFKAFAESKAHAYEQFEIRYKEISAQNLDADEHWRRVNAVSEELGVFRSMTRSMVDTLPSGETTGGIPDVDFAGHIKADLMAQFSDVLSGTETGKAILRSWRDKSELLTDEIRERGSNFAVSVHDYADHLHITGLSEDSGAVIVRRMMDLNDF